MHRYLVNTAILLGLIALSGLVYIRLAPDDLLALHVPPPLGAAPGQPVRTANSYLVEEQIPRPPAPVLAQLDATILATPRTRLIAGNAQQRMLTYVTRSRIFGFPDYTTVRVAAGDGGSSRVQIYARSRYGRSDRGVNKARVVGWLKALKALD